MKKILVLAAVVAILALAFPLTAMAAGPEDTKIILGSNYTLSSGDGNISIAGEVEGDLGVLGGNVDLMGTAVIGGDVVTLGGNIDRVTGSVIEGEITPNFGIDIDSPLPNIPSSINYIIIFSWILSRCSSWPHWRCW